MKQKISKRFIGLTIGAALVAGATVAINTSQSVAAPQTVNLTGQDKRDANATTLPGQRSGAIYSAAFSPDVKWLASGDDRGRISLWDTATNKLKTTLTGAETFIESLAWSPEGNELLSVGILHIKDGSVGGTEFKIWNVVTGKARFQTKWPDYYAELAAWSPDGKTIALAGSKVETNKLFPQIELRAADSGKVLRTLTPRRDNKSLNRLQFSPDSRLLLTLLHWECEGNLWDVESGKAMRDLKPSPDLKIPFAADVFAFSPDSKTLARGRHDGSLILEETHSGALVRTFKKQPPFAIATLGFSPDGTTLWSLNPFEVFKWNATTGDLISKSRFSGGSDMILSADGTLAAGYSNQNLFLTRL